MSKITLQSEMKGDADIFAVVAWPDLVGNLLCSEPLNFPYVDVMEKLLSIDLVACSIKAITSDDGIMHRLSDDSPYVSNLYHSFIRPFQNHRSFMSEPLAQRVVTHAESSFEYTLVDFLLQSPFEWPSGFGSIFIQFVDVCRGNPEGTWTIDNNNQVVKALRRLWEEHPQHISEIMRHCDDLHVEKLLRVFDCYHDEPGDSSDSDSSSLYLSCDDMSD
jgi:hypothetical protein